MSRAGLSWPGFAAWLSLTLVASSAAIVVPGTANPWLAGMPNGSAAREGDVAPDQSPVEVMAVPIVPGSVLIFSVSGEVRKGPAQPFFPPDGDPIEIAFKVWGSENGLADVIAPKNALLGVFLGDAPPDQSPAPASMSFITSASRHAATLTPQVKQVFFIGDGLAGDDTPQRIVVPSGATRLFLGTMDGVGWFNNEGAFAVEVRLETPSITIDDAMVTEGNSGTAVAVFVVRLSIPSGRTVSVDYTTADGTAVADADYVPAVGRLEFAPGETSRSIRVEVLGDAQFETNETYFVNFRGSSNGIIGRNQAQGTIINDDVQDLPPIVAVTSPVSGSVVTQFSTLSVVAIASDPDGPVIKVEFFQDGLKVGEDTADPFGIMLTNRLPGARVLTATARDAGGLISTSAPVVITVQPPPNLPPRVTVTGPIPEAKLTAWTAIRLSAEASDPDGTIARVEFFVDSTLIGVSSAGPFGVVWSNPSAGSYLITVRATDDRGAAATNSVRVSVIPVSADVAIVRDADHAEVSKLQEFLLEIGLTSDAFAPADLTLETLRLFKLIIWDDLGARTPSLTETTVRAFSDAFTHGVPIYFIGEDLASAAAHLSEPFRSRWSELVHLVPVNGPRPVIPISWLDPELRHPILNGRFGVIEEFAYDGVMLSAVATGAGIEVLGRAGGTDVMVAYPEQDQPDTGGARSVTQSFLSVSQGDDASKIERKELFQNAVCWLLRCPRCSAINLRMEMAGSSESARLGAPFTYEFSVLHSGECEATGVVVTGTLPGNARFVRAETAQGNWRMEAGVITFNLGRVPNGSRTVMSVTVLPLACGELRSSARVRVNGPEVILDDNASELTTGIEGGVPVVLGIEPSAAGSPQLRLIAEPGRRFRIQTSTNLVTWMELTNNVGDGWTIGLSAAAGSFVTERFFRAVSP